MIIQSILDLTRRYWYRVCIGLAVVPAFVIVTINAVLLDYIPYGPGHPPIQTPPHWLMQQFTPVPPCPAGDLIPVYVRPFRFAIPGPWRTVVHPLDGAVILMSAASVTITIEPCSRIDHKEIDGGPLGNKPVFRDWYDAALPRFGNDFDLICFRHSVTENDLRLLQWPPMIVRVRQVLHRIRTHEMGLIVARHGAVDIAFSLWETGTVSRIDLFARELRQKMSISISHNYFPLEETQWTKGRPWWSPTSVPGIDRPAVDFTPSVMQSFIDSVGLASTSDDERLRDDLRRRGEDAFRRRDWSLAAVMLGLTRNALDYDGTSPDRALTDMLDQAESENKNQIFAALRQAQALPGGIASSAIGPYSVPRENPVNWDDLRE